ncbi:MAG: hypothetical protein ABW168_19120 [Sedimenticola sp.]
MFISNQDAVALDRAVAVNSVAELLDFLAEAMPDGELFLFGGVLRDLALFGKKGFKSDLDLVVEGDWSNLTTFLDHLGVPRNKFGGYRFVYDNWLIDIWNAKETWAIKQGFVKYDSIFSLTETTVLNWDAILMNWRTKSFIHPRRYFEDIENQVMHVVLEENPNPLGMAVRVFRHLCHKNAKSLSMPAIEYLMGAANQYSYDELHMAERNSYGLTYISKDMYQLFFDASQAHGSTSRYKYLNARYGLEVINGNR